MRYLAWIMMVLFIVSINVGCGGSKKSVRQEQKFNRYTLKKKDRKKNTYTSVVPTKKKKSKKNKKKVEYKGPKVFDCISSYYARKYHGKKTASGEIFNMFDYTAAHKTLPFGTIVKVYNLKNKKAIVIRINDRGPFIKGRELDLSFAAAQALDFVRDGTAKVRVQIVRLGKK